MNLQLHLLNNIYGALFFLVVVVLVHEVSWGWEVQGALSGMEVQG